MDYGYPIDNQIWNHPYYTLIKSKKDFFISIFYCSLKNNISKNNSNGNWVYTKRNLNNLTNWKKYFCAYFNWKLIFFFLHGSCVEHNQLAIKIISDGHHMAIDDGDGLVDEINTFRESLVLTYGQNFKFYLLEFKKSDCNIFH